MTTVYLGVHIQPPPAGPPHVVNQLHDLNLQQGAANNNAAIVVLPADVMDPAPVPVDRGDGFGLEVRMDGPLIDENANNSIHSD